jgi:tol-pal system protein YbgF
VFNNGIEEKKLQKARGGSALCLCLMLAGLMGGTATLANAQSNEMNNRLNRLENEIETLNRAVYRGEQPPQAPQRLFNGSGATDAQANAQMEIRLQQLETQIRELTGKIEEQVYTINQLQNDITAMQDAGINAAPQQPPQPNMARMGMEQPPLGQDPAQNAPAVNPMGLDWEQAQAPTGIQTATSLPSNTDATSLYETAYADLKNSRYTEAREGFEDFLEAHPNHILSANAKYWLGETFYVQGDYKQSAKIFAQGFQTFPDSAKSPDMLLKLGLSLANLDKTDEACIALSQLPVKFKAGPQTVLDRGAEEMDRLNCTI